MIQYCVSITETLSTVVIVDAIDEDDAVDKVRAAYGSGLIELGSGDYQNDACIVVEDQYDPSGEEQHVE